MRKGRNTYLPGAGGVGRFAPGHWRADAPTGAPALPSGPGEGYSPPAQRLPTTDDGSGRLRDPRTAANMAAKAEALAPRRWRPV